MPLLFGLGTGIVVGRNAGSSITKSYSSPFEFTGTIDQVTVDLSGDLIADTEEEKHAQAKAAMARQ